MKTILFSFSILVAANICAQNVGINSDGTSPEAGVMLDVKGTNAKATTAVVQTLLQLKSFDANTDALKLRMGFKTDATATNRYGFIDFPDFTGGAPTYRNLSLQPSGGNVGIGTTSPGALLDIYGPGGPNGNSPAMLRLTSTSDRPGIVLNTIAGNASGAEIHFQKQSAGEFSIYDYNGAAKLAIYDAAVAADAFSIMGGKTTIGNQAATSGSIFNVIGNVSIGSAYYVNAAPANGMLVEGNVGIGNIAPAEKLHVTGNIRASSLAGTGTALVQADANGTLQRSGISGLIPPLVAVDIDHNLDPTVPTNHDNFVGLMAAYVPSTGRVWVISTNYTTNIENMDIPSGTPGNEWNPDAGNNMVWVDFGDPNGVATDYVIALDVAVNTFATVTDQSAAIITVRMSNGDLYVRTTNSQNISAASLDNAANWSAWQILVDPGE